MKIHFAILAAKTDIQKAIHVDSSGKELTTIKGDLFGYRTESDLEIVRGDLCRILFDQIFDVECLFGHSIISCSETSDSLKKDILGLIFLSSVKETIDWIWNLSNKTRRVSSRRSSNQLMHDRAN